MQPVSATVPAGKPVTFTAAASGAPVPTVQWQVSANGGDNSATSPAPTSTTYSFSTRPGETGNEYQAVFTNSQGSATTSPPR